MTTPAMTAQEALAILASYHTAPSMAAVVETLKRALSDAERRATEAEQYGGEARIREKKTEDARIHEQHLRSLAEARLSAVEARCGLMRDCVAALVAAWEALPEGNWDKWTIEGWLLHQMKPAIDGARSILAYPEGKSDQGEKEKPVADDEHWERDVFDPPAGGEGKPDERRTQVAAQCRTIDHLGRTLAGVYADYVQILATGGDGADIWVESVGRRTADLMETLGDILNGMDAVTDDDAWIEPIYKKAHELWPAPLSRSGDSALVEARRLLEDGTISVTTSSNHGSQVTVDFEDRAIALQFRDLLERLAEHPEEKP